MSRLVVAIAHVEFTIANQTLYVVNVQQDTDEWEVRRTYSDFRRLRDDVARVMKRECSASGSGDACSQQFAAAVHDLPFPAKRLFGSRSDRVVRERAVELHQFLIKLLLLTHTYRKAQKQLYDGQTHVTPQASASVFYLLRDFLKPVASASGKSTGSRSDYGGASSSVNGSTNGQSDNDDDLAMRRMIRESKMLSMRTSGHQHQPPPATAAALKTKSAPNVLVYNSDDSDGSYHQHVATSASAALLRQQSSIPLLEEAPRSRKGGGDTKHSDTSSNKSTSKTINSSLLRSRSHRTESTPDRSHHDASASNERPRNVSNASNASSSVYSSASRKLSTASSEPDTSSTVSQHQSQPTPSVLSSVQQRRTPSAPIAIAPASASSSVPSSSSSSVYLHGSAPSSTSSAAVSRAYPSSNYDSNTQSNTQANARMYTAYYDDSDDDNATLVAMSRAVNTSAHERRAKAADASKTKKPAAARTKARSVSAREARTSERKSKLSPQLTAQAVTIEAQKALEQCVSEYSAIMILRYVDRFISKAVTKTPGCYTVSSSSHRLVIDTERFVEELDETFKDLPADFAMHFRAGGNGDWRFPPALDAYVQMKWKSFQGHATSGVKHSASARYGSRASRRSSRRRVESDGSDSEETEYEYEETIGGGGGYMKPKRVFTDEVADVLDKMIAEGTAGRDQMLRLRRQKNEMGWDRRANPSGSEHSGVSRSTHKTEYWTDTDDDEHRQTGSSGAGGDGRASTAVEHYQQKYNALRKERLSRREGGLV